MKKIAKALTTICLNLTLSSIGYSACYSIPDNLSENQINMILRRDAQYESAVVRTLRNGGKLLFMGGVDFDSNGYAKNVSKRSFLYNPAAHSACELGQMSIPRQLAFMSVELNDGRVLVAGGLTSNQRNTAKADLLNPDTGIWESVGSLAYSVRDVQLALMPSGNVLAVGGNASLKTGARWINFTQVFNIGSKTFGKINQLDRGRFFFALQAHTDGRMLLVGGGFDIFDVGFASCANNNAVLAYNELLNKWTNLGDINPSPRYGYSDDSWIPKANAGMKPIHFISISDSQILLKGGQSCTNDGNPDTLIDL